jgi:2-polyprenyl-6-methoxyphenol hydroxylase-like FAD-dependent oxidoreductase
LAGQGLNLGIGDVAALTRCLAEAVRRGQDVGSAGVLRPFDQRQRLANTALIGAIHSVFHLFQFVTSPNHPTHFHRRTHLLHFDSIPETMECLPGFVILGWI